MKKWTLDPDEILASPEKKQLTQDIEAAMLKRCTEAWLEFYDYTEAIDRKYPHDPAVDGKSVRTHAARLSYAQREEIKEFRVALNRRISGVKAPIIQQAQRDALKLHQTKLEPCRCEVCEG